MENNNVITANLNEIVFEGRNKSYGGYMIRKTFNRRMFISLVIVSVAIVLLTLLAWLAPVQTGMGESLTQSMHTLIDIPVLPEPEEPTIAPPVELEKDKTEEPVIEQPKEETPKETGMDTEKSQVPVPDDKTTTENTITEQDKFKNKNPDTETSTGNKGTTIGTPPGDDKGPLVPETTPKVEEPLETDFHAGKMPEALNLDHIKKRVVYPAILREAGMEGKVVFRVLVGPDGEYIRHVVKRSNHPEFTKACESEIKKLKFTPGEENGKPVKVWVTIPFKFTLSR